METDNKNLIIRRPSKPSLTPRTLGAKNQPGYIAEQPLHAISTSGEQQAQLAKVNINEQLEQRDKIYEAFSAKAKELNELWYKFQKEILIQDSDSISRQETEEPRKLLYWHILSAMPHSDFHAFITLKILSLDERYANPTQEQVKQKFLELPARKQRELIDNYQAQVFNDRKSRDRKDSITHKALLRMLISTDDATKIAKVKIEKYVFANLGEEETWQSFTKQICLAQQEEYLFLIKDLFFKEAEQHGFKYEGMGDLGIVFSHEVNGHKAAFKVSLYPPSSELGKFLAFQEDQLQKLEQVTKGKNCSFFLPQLLRNSQGELLGVPGRVSVLKFQNGSPIKTPNPKNPSAASTINPDYHRMGIDNQFVVDYIDFYLTAAKSGLDIHDLRPGNFFHQGRHFQVIEAGGADTSRTQALIPKRQEMPEAFMLYSLMESIFMIGSDFRRSITPRENVSMRHPELVDKILSGEPGNSEEEFTQKTKEFIGHQFAQMIDCLDLAIQQGIISPRQIIKGIHDLRKIYEAKDGMPFIFPKKQANEYNYSDYFFMDYLENHLKNQIGVRKFYQQCRRDSREFYYWLLGNFLK